MVELNKTVITWVCFLVGHNNNVKRGCRNYWNAWWMLVLIWLIFKSLLIKKKETKGRVYKSKQILFLGILVASGASLIISTFLIKKENSCFQISQVAAPESTLCSAPLEVMGKAAFFQQSKANISLGASWKTRRKGNVLGLQKWSSLLHGDNLLILGLLGKGELLEV